MRILSFSNSEKPLIIKHIDSYAHLPNQPDIDNSLGSTSGAQPINLLESPSFPSSSLHHHSLSAHTYQPIIAYSSRELQFLNFTSFSQPEEPREPPSHRYYKIRQKYLAQKALEAKAPSISDSNNITVPESQFGKSEEQPHKDESPGNESQNSARQFSIEELEPLTARMGRSNSARLSHTPRLTTSPTRTSNATKSDIFPVNKADILAASIRESFPDSQTQNRSGTDSVEFTPKNIAKKQHNTASSLSRSLAQAQEKKYSKTVVLPNLPPLPSASKDHGEDNTTQKRTLDVKFESDTTFESPPQLRPNLSAQDLLLDESPSGFISLDSTRTPYLSLDSTQSLYELQETPTTPESESARRFSSTKIPSQTNLLNAYPQRHRQSSTSMSLSQFNKKGLKINVRRRSSTYDSSIISPVSSASYASLSPSPAVSFLMGLAEKTNPQMAEPGVYSEGDQIGNYVLGREIGSGSFSKVFAAYYVSETNYFTAKWNDQPETLINQGSHPAVAIKIVRKDQDLEGNGAANDVIRLLEHETSVWSQLRHPSIVQMLDVFEVQDAIFVVSELCEGGNLLHYIERQPNGLIPEQTAKSMFRQIAEAVLFLHETAKIVHRDIKLENILLTYPDTDQIVVKLADFGLSDYIADNSPPSEATLLCSDPIFCMGSLPYCAPEEFKSNLLKQPESDVWSIGCVLYAMLTGTLPFADDFVPRLQSMIINGRYDTARLETLGVSHSARDLISKIFKTKPEQRLTIREVLDHSWLHF